MSFLSSWAWLISLIIMISDSIQVANDKKFYCFYNWVIFYSVYAPPFHCPISRKNLTLLLLLVYCKQCYYACVEWRHLLKSSVAFSLDTTEGLPDHVVIPFLSLFFSFEGTLYVSTMACTDYRSVNNVHSALFSATSPRIAVWSSNRSEVISHCDFELHFPNWHLFSCAYCPFTSLNLINNYPFFFHWTLWLLNCLIPYICWLVIYHHMCNFKIFSSISY